MVIVEYCRFGNLKDFLKEHRDFFIDQIVRDQDIIDPMIQTKEQCGRYSNGNDIAYVVNPNLLKLLSVFWLLCN